MSTPPFRPRLLATFAWAMLALCTTLDAGAAVSRRVLILQSFGRDVAPYDTITSVFRTELAQRSTEPITFVEANLDFGRRATETEQQAFRSYLRARFDEAPPDVVVTVGPAAGRFYVLYRNELFGNTPVVVGGLEARLAQELPLSPNDSVVAGRFDLPGLVRHVLQVLPDTETIAVIVGASDTERFWTSVLKREFAPFAGRVEFEWMNELSLVQIKERVAKLPPRSAIMFGLFIVDAAGVPHERRDGLDGLHAAANAPIFGLYETELGRGVVGGPYSSQRANGEEIAQATLDALNGRPPSVSIRDFEPPVYDWRELERWKIDRARLPAGSEIRYRPPSLWEQHRTAVLATATAVAVQAALITALLLQRARRRRAELDAEGLAGRLVTAHEDERRRLARELHDDVTQRLAGLAIEAAELEGGKNAAGKSEAAHSIREGLVELGEDVHALSYRLHPSVIEDLGLVEALRIECDRVAQLGPLRVNFDSAGVPNRLPADAALCLFRIAQEALRNVERHARASHVDVSVSRVRDGIALSVRDDGAGFDASGSSKRASLGLASMRERVRILEGRFEIDSAPGNGTALAAWLPLPAAP